VGLFQNQNSTTCFIKTTLAYKRLHPEEFSGKLEGDIAVRPGEENQVYNAIVDRSRRWTNGIVPYEISDAFDAARVLRIEEGIDTLNSQTRVNGQQCINIIPHTNEVDYIYIDQLSGCWSFIGRSGGEQDLSIGRGCERIGTVMHEILHAMGFYHEQSRSDRDNFVIINYDNIRSGSERNFRRMEEGTIDLLNTSYDYNSCMHYGAYSFAVDRTIPTIITIDPDAEIGQRTRLSTLDIQRVQKLYDCIPTE
ncbi:unnamed protein product, partial [Owenia fusiformis]